MSYLFDTCILSKLQRIKKYPDPLLQEWIERHPSNLFYISVLTIAEIQSGIAKLCEKGEIPREKAAALEDWLFNDLIPGFHGRILDFDVKLALRWGSLVGKYKSRGINLPIMDSLIAATALHYELIIVTENSADFDIEDLLTINPCTVV